MPDPFFDQAYRGRPPWDIGRPQPAFVELANAGAISGSVLDLGCGTGEVSLDLAERGHEAWGVDISPNAIDQARAKAKLRSLDATFLVGNALELEHLNRKFDTAIDCGLFHVFSDPERELYAQQLTQVLHEGGTLHVLCFSDWEDASWGGPRRVSQAELIDTFRDGWRVDDIREARFVVDPRIRIKGHCWLATFVRDGKAPPKRKKAKPGLVRPAPPSKAKRALPVVQAGLAT